jgi:23S rRNA (cytidine1920-2'-O)/16S rRNA (cytidine1409-2'-O)-methyltransferase
LALPGATRDILRAMQFVSRAGRKLEHALDTFGVEVDGLTCADFGCNTGGFTDCLLQRGAMKVYAIDTGYGVLEWKLRKDPRVIVMERTNAMHVELPEKMQLIVIDVAWTKQRAILPAAARVLAPDGIVVSLIKPHYEADAKLLRGGVLPEEHLAGVVEHDARDIATAGFSLFATTVSPIRGAKGNTEMLAHLIRAQGATTSAGH